MTLAFQLAVLALIATSRHLWRAGSVTTYTLPFTPYHRAFSSVAGFSV